MPTHHELAAAMRRLCGVPPHERDTIYNPVPVVFKMVPGPQNKLELAYEQLDEDQAGGARFGRGGALIAWRACVLYGNMARKAHMVAQREEAERAEKARVAHEAQAELDEKILFVMETTLMFAT